MDDHQPTTEEPKVQHSSLQEWKAATPRDIVIELERLAIHYPRPDMDTRKWAVLFETFNADLQGRSLEEIRLGCQRYRQNHENRFFPTPGQLLAACKNQYGDSPGARRPFFRASDDERRRDAQTRAELDAWTREKVSAKP